MTHERAAESEIGLDYRPLRDAIDELCGRSGENYHDIAVRANVPFPKVLRLMAGNDAGFAGVHVVNLARMAGLPLSELTVAAEGGRP